VQEGGTGDRRKHNNLRRRKEKNWVERTATRDPREALKRIPMSAMCARGLLGQLKPFISLRKGI